MEEGVEHKGKEGEPMKPSDGGRKPFIVLGEAAKASCPSKGAFHDPSPGQEDEAFPGLCKFDHDEAYSLLGGGLGGLLSGVALIDKCHEGIRKFVCGS